MMAAGGPRAASAAARPCCRVPSCGESESNAAAGAAPCGSAEMPAPKLLDVAAIIESESHSVGQDYLACRRGHGPAVTATVHWLVGHGRLLPVNGGWLNKVGHSESPAPSGPGLSSDRE